MVKPVPEDVSNSQNVSSKRTALECARDLIARAEQCSKGLAKKLIIRGYDAASVSAVVFYLIEEDLINDERFARLWLGFRFRQKSESPREMMDNICRRGIDRKTALRALQAVFESYPEINLLKNYIKNSKKFKKNYKISGKDSFRTILRFEQFSAEVLDLYSDTNFEVQA